MISSDPSLCARRILVCASFFRRLAAFLLFGFCCCLNAFVQTSAAPVDGSESEIQVDAGPHFIVETYDVEGGPKLSMDAVFPILSKYTGTNVSLSDIAAAAAAVQAECRKAGYPRASVAVASEQITNGIVTINVFQAASPQIIISGVRYFATTNGTELQAYSPARPALPLPAPKLAAAPAPLAPAPPLPPPPRPAPYHRPKPATPEQIAAARKLLYQEIPRLEAEGEDHRIHVVSTNAGPRFNVEHYIILGNSVLTAQTISATLTNIDGAFGTNVSFEGIKTVVEQLQETYHDRGFLTVAVTLPQQKLANQTVKIQVLEGRVTAINVVGNTFFSSNNVMRNLPSLHTNIVIDAPVLQAELNRANANQDREIIPIVGPGPDPGTSVLTLRVKDRLPLHAKVDLDNQNSPGTPDLRVNSSAVYNNLWQEEHSAGVQYSFSPDQFKDTPDWHFYDRPSVADYSAFYRFPLGNPPSLEDQITAHPGTFGYDEATRQFNMPPASGRPEITLFASRATIDNGLETLSSETIVKSTTNSLSEATVQDDQTINNDVGARLDLPLKTGGDFHSGFSSGLDFKTYKVTSFKTNNFTITSLQPVQGTGNFTNVTTTVPSTVPTTVQNLEYLPLSLHYDAGWVSPLGSTTVGMDLSANLWYSGDFQTFSTTEVIATNRDGSISTNFVNSSSNHGKTGLQDITGSKESTGHWVILRPSFTQVIPIYNWTTVIRADGQWSSEPVIPNEQFGAGGVNSVRGYHEGEVFGDNGWHVSLEEQTPPQVIGTVYDGAPLVVRGSIYFDYAAVYLIDPEGRPSSTRLAGTGIGLAASVGSHWQAQFLFSFPLESAGTVEAYQPYFNFALTAQF
jgi:hemolysin activation/secretion protein